MDNNLKVAAASAVKQCLGIKAGEKVLVICDSSLRQVGYSLWQAATDLGAEAMFMEMTKRSRHGEEPPDAVAEAMKAVDVVIAPTTASLTHTKARRQANSMGARIATLPDVNEDIVCRTLIADYSAIDKETTRLASLLETAENVILTSENGTDLKLKVKGRNWQLDTGVYKNPGEFGNLPGGECYVAPIEGSANGVIVLDGSIAGYGHVDEPVKVIIKDGLAVNFRGGNAAVWLENLLTPFGEKGLNIAELGIGTNPLALVKGKLIEDEKVKGTVHIAFGNNASFGGMVEVPLHVDAMIMKPNLIVDGKNFILEGVHVY